MRNHPRIYQISIKMKTQFKIFIISSFLFIFSCSSEEVDLSEFDFEVINANSIAVEGYVSTDSTHHYVRIRTIGEINKNDSKTVSSAEVSVWENDIEHRFEILSDSVGIYKSVEAFRAHEGKTYILKIKYGNVVYSASDTVVIPSLSNFSTFPEMRIYNVINGTIFISLNQHNFGYPFPNIWIKSTLRRPFETSCHSSLLYAGNESIYTHSGTPLNGQFPIGTLGGGISGNPNDTVVFIRITTSNTYWKFLNDVFDETDWGAGLFSTIKGNARSNVTNGGFGFFACLYTERFPYTYRELLDSLGLKPYD